MHPCYCHRTICAEKGDWIKCSLVAIALNNNLRIRKFRAKLSTYYMRAFIKRSICNYFYTLHSVLAVAMYQREWYRDAHTAPLNIHKEAQKKNEKKFNKKAKSIQRCRCCWYLICGVVVVFLLSVISVFFTRVAHLAAVAIFAIPFALLHFDYTRSWCIVAGTLNIKHWSLLM